MSDLTTPPSPNLALQRTRPAAAVFVFSKVARAGRSAELWRYALNRTLADIAKRDVSST